MRILIIGSQEIWAIENLYNKYLNQNGAESEIYPIHDLFYDFYYKNIFNKLLFRINPSFIYGKLNDDLLKFILLHSFDIVWVFKGMEIYPTTLKAIRDNGIKLVNYNPDHPFYFSGKGSGNANVLNSIACYDLHFCYHNQVMQRIKGEYGIPCHYLPFGYEPVNINFPVESEELLKACFIGNPDNIRANYIQALIDHGIPVDVYGNEWDKYLKLADNTGVFPAIYIKQSKKPLFEMACSSNRPFQPANTVPGPLPLRWH